MFFAGALLALGALAAWMQLLLLPPLPAPGARGDIDYYIENFSSSGADAHGKTYRLSASLLENHPRDARARLTRPHIVQTTPSGAARHTYADSGWLHHADGRVELSGNVRARQSGESALAENTLQLKSE